MPYNPKDLFIH
jgi:thiamine kinase-like enzyme